MTQMGMTHVGMTHMMVSLAVWLGGGVLALVLGRFPRLCSGVAVASALSAALFGLWPALDILSGGPTQTYYHPWRVPLASLAMELDALSAFFAVPILVLAALAAVHGASYFQSYAGKKNVGVIWFWFHLLVAGMLTVVLARNGVLFLTAWELMSLSAFFLVTVDDEKENVRQAGWTFLIATHLGTAFLLALFLLLGQGAGTLDFDEFGGGAALTGGTANLLFVLALFGFGAKAGFLPLHVWLPEAHPAAPSPVSALLSGIMIKTGIYGLLRVLTFLGTPPLWWGWALIGIGLSSGILGIVLALAQKDLKRLLAYSSVENIGIIALGLGTGLLGLSTRQDTVAVLGFAGAMLHVLNHALYKGLLFLGAGTVLHATRTAELDRLGGLMRRMPGAGLAFLVGAAAICGLPPGNGFLSKFLIFRGALEEEVANAGLALPGLAVIGGLALVSGLAVACFTKAFGTVFLGQPRSKTAADAHPPGPGLTAPMLLLAAGCLVVSLASPWLMPVLARAISPNIGRQAETVESLLWEPTTSLFQILLVCGVLVILLIGLVVLRLRLLTGRPVTALETWSCGYALPTPRMQYTASSFSQPLTDVFQPAIGMTKQAPESADYFPRAAALVTDTPEPWRELLYRPLFAGFAWCFGRLRWLQHGRVQLYVLYVALTTLVLLVFFLR